MRWYGWAFSKEEAIGTLCQKNRKFALERLHKRERNDMRRQEEAQVEKMQASVYSQPICSTSVLG
jgi:hypothetical protein